MYKITLLDRLIINSLTKENLNTYSISKYTSIDERIVSIVLQDFIVKNIVTFSNEKYQLNPHMSKEQIEEINNEQDLENEKILISKSLIRKKEHFKLKKFSLTPKDQILFEGMLKNISLFLENNQNKLSATREECLFIFGFGNYSEIVKDTIY